MTDLIKTKFSWTTYFDKKYNGSIVAIDISRLLNSNFLDYFDPIPTDLLCHKMNTDGEEIIYDLELVLTGKNDRLNLDKLMDKLINVKKLCIKDIKNKKISRLPPNLVKLNMHYYNEIVTFPNTLLYYEISWANIPINLPTNVTEIQMTGNYNETTFLNMPSNLKKLTFNINTLETYINNWPLNLKYICIESKTEFLYSIGILPYDLKSFLFIHDTEFTYNFPIEFPPTLTYIMFITYNFIDDSLIKRYKYQDIFNNLHDNVRFLEIDYRLCPNIVKLPKYCKNFEYMNCPDNIIKDLRTKFPNCKINLDHYDNEFYIHDI